jgi:transcriptional regulator with XRE-family HTH domain
VTRINTVKNVRGKSFRVHRSYLKERREELHVTAEEVASEIGISHHYYSQLENGDKGKKLSVRLLLEMARGLDFMLCDILRKEKTYIDTLDKATKRRERFLNE